MSLPSQNGNVLCYKDLCDDAKSACTGACPGHGNSDFVRVANAWPSLPAHVKQTILMLVESASLTEEEAQSDG